MADQFRFKSVPCTLLVVLVLTPAALFAQQEKDKPEASPAKTEASPAKTEKDDKVVSGMSILGNQDAPKSLVIVPWKGSELGDSVGISTMLDDSRLPIDKEVFMRMLSYYEIRSETAHPSAAPAKENAAQPAAAQRRK
jgi:hypothetical protein